MNIKKEAEDESIFLQKNGPPDQEIDQFDTMSPEFNKLTKDFHQKIEGIYSENGVNQSSEIDTELDKQNRFGAVPIHPLSKYDDNGEAKQNKTRYSQSNDVLLESDSECPFTGSEIDAVQQKYMKIAKVQQSKKEDPVNELQALLNDFKPKKDNQGKSSLQAIRDCSKMIRQKISSFYSLKLQTQKKDLDDISNVQFIVQTFDVLFKIIESHQEESQKIRKFSHLMNIDGDIDFNDIEVASIKSQNQKYEMQSILQRPQQTVQSDQNSNSKDSQMTSQRSHFTSIEGPPKIYEDIMRQLEADVRKHIRIEHQLKLHIESVEDRVEELEREQQAYQKQIKQLEKNKLEASGLLKELKSKQEVYDVKEILFQKQESELQSIKKNSNLLQQQIKEQKSKNTIIQQEKEQLFVELRNIKQQSLKDRNNLVKLTNQPYEALKEDQYGLDLLNGGGISGNSATSDALRSMNSQYQGTQDRAITDCRHQQSSTNISNNSKFKQNNEEIQYRSINAGFQTSKGQSVIKGQKKSNNINNGIIIQNNSANRKSLKAQALSHENRNSHSRGKNETSRSLYAQQKSQMHNSIQGAHRNQYLTNSNVQPFSKNSKRGVKKQSKHGSLEKTASANLGQATLYGTQAVVGVNSQQYLAGVPPQLHLKMQDIINNENNPVNFKNLNPNHSHSPNKNLVLKKKDDKQILGANQMKFPQQVPKSLNQQTMDADLQNRSQSLIGYNLSQTPIISKNPSKNAPNITSLNQMKNLPANQKITSNTHIQNIYSAGKSQPKQSSKHSAQNLIRSQYESHQQLITNPELMSNPAYYNTVNAKGLNTDAQINDIVLQNTWVDNRSENSEKNNKEPSTCGTTVQEREKKNRNSIQMQLQKNKKIVRDQQRTNMNASQSSNRGNSKGRSKPKQQNQTSSLSLIKQQNNSLSSTQKMNEQKHQRPLSRNNQLPGQTSVQNLPSSAVVGVAPYKAEKNIKLAKSSVNHTYSSGTLPYNQYSSESNGRNSALGKQKIPYKSSGVNSRMGNHSENHNPKK